MLYFPIIEDGMFPSWFPIWGGESFVFFRPVFNIADAAISGGVFSILLFQSKFFPSETPTKPTQEETEGN
jgi:signal peptidase II